MTDDDARAKWIARRAANPKLSSVADSGRAFYRPDELLLGREAEERFGPELADRYRGGCYAPGRFERHWRDRVEPRADLNARLGAVGLQLWVLEPDSEIDLPGIVDNFRRDDSAGRDLALNHVLTGEGKYQGGPGTSPASAPALTLAESCPGESPDLAVLDTGVPQGWQQMHPALLNLRPDSDDTDVLGQDGDQRLDPQAGHGLFIAGLALRVAPGLTIDPGRVLDPTGVGDDATLGPELAEVMAPVVNLSLGGYTEDDAGPPALLAAIARLIERGTAVVAAAGNAGEDPEFQGRPFWPAALDDVIAVGAYDSTTSAATPPLASFSNSGPWVNLYAPGVNVQSTYLRAEMADEHGARFDGWATWSGTSFAAPQIAAEIASRLHDGSGRSAWQIGQDLLAQPWPTATYGKIYSPPLLLTL